MNPFEVGKVYRRVQDIHDHYKGQRYGGICTPNAHPYVFLFTGESGAQYGYHDEFQPDGTFWLTGEGQVGDMKMIRGNAAIRDHVINGKSLVLFEDVSNGRVRCIGEATYLGHHIEEKPDRNKIQRNAIVFELEVNRSESSPIVLQPETENPNERTLRLWSRPLAEVRSLAVNRPATGSGPSTRRIIIRQRSEAVRVYVLRRANGKCEACKKDSPFVTIKHRPYLEPHHIHRLADGGPDTPDAVAAVCPNCHKEIHHGLNGGSVNAELAAKIQAFEKEND